MSVSNILDPQHKMIYAMVDMIAHVAVANGRVNDSELEICMAFLSGYGLDDGQWSFAYQAWDHCLTKPQNFEESALYFRETFQNQPDTLEQFVGILMHLALSKGEMQEEERAVINIIAMSLFGFSESKMINIYTGVKNELIENGLDAALNAFGVSYDTNFSEISFAFDQIHLEYDCLLKDPNHLSDEKFNEYLNRHNQIKRAFFIIREWTVQKAIEEVA